SAPRLIAGSAGRSWSKRDSNAVQKYWASTLALPLAQVMILPSWSRASTNAWATCSMAGPAVLAACAVCSIWLANHWLILCSVSVMVFWLVCLNCVFDPLYTVLAGLAWCDADNINPADPVPESVAVQVEGGGAAQALLLEWRHRADRIHECTVGAEANLKEHQRLVIHSNKIDLAAPIVHVPLENPDSPAFEIPGGDTF